MDLAALFGVVWRRKSIVAAFAIVTAVLGLAFAYALTPLYTARSVVMLDVDQEQIIDVQSVAQGLGADSYTITAQSNVLTSRSLAGRVVDAENLTANPYFNPSLIVEERPNFFVRALQDGIGLIKRAIRGAVSDAEAPKDVRTVMGDDYWARQTAVDILLGALTVETIDKTYVYEISIETPDPILSAELANKFAELYILDQLETKFEATQAATEWLADRVAQLKTEVEEAEAAVEAYNSNTTLISEGALGGMNRQLKELRERKNELESQKQAYQARVAAITAAQESGDRQALAEAIGMPRLTDMARRIAEGDGADDGAALVESFDSLSARLIAQAGSELDRATGQLASVTGSITDLETELESQTQDLVELRQLQREAEASRRIYEQFLRRLNETSVQEGTQKADARVLSEAVVNFAPSFPKKNLIVLAAAFLGGLLGVAAVIIADQINNAFRSQEEMERFTGLPVLGAIPLAPVRMRRSLLEYAVERPTSALTEAVRNLRTGILLANVDRTPKVVMLTSSLPKEGKTTCSLLLAQNAAGMGKKVLLMECDLRRRTFRSYFPDSPRVGLMTLLLGEKSFEEVVHHDERTGIDVILGEEATGNPADIYASRKFADFLAEARERYDFIVVDTPPVLAVPDSRVIAPLVDAVIYCVRWNSTSRELVRNGLQQFSQIKLRVTGLAMTQVNTKKMSRYGYGGYSYQYYKSTNKYYLN